MWIWDSRGGIWWNRRWRSSATALERLNYLNSSEDIEFLSSFPAEPARDISLDEEWVRCEHQNLFPSSVSFPSSKLREWVTQRRRSAHLRAQLVFLCSSHQLTASASRSAIPFLFPHPNSLLSPEYRHVQSRALYESLQFSGTSVTSRNINGPNRKLWSIRRFVSRRNYTSFNYWLFHPPPPPAH